ncbi:MAG: radical SAM protein, partial [Deltaproteobacteria bacterium]
DLVPDFPLRLQPNVFNYRASPVASVVTSRGCPFSCSFCDRSTSGRKGRFHGVDYVVRLCRRLADLGVRHILFYDDLFTVSRRRVLELCERFLAEGFRFTWSCNSHPNLLDPATLRLMRRAGCWQIAYGIESGSQRILDVVKHEVKLPRMLDTLRATRAAGIRVKGLLMMRTASRRPSTSSAPRRSTWCRSPSSRRIPAPPRTPPCASTGRSPRTGSA